MNTIDYSKYEDMTKRQIVISLENAEKRRNKLHSKVQHEDKLIQFLKAKMNEALKEKKYDFISLEESGLRELYEETKKNFTEQELQEIENEMMAEIRKYDDEK